MKVGLVGFQGGGKSALFQLLTGHVSDPSKIQSGQVGEMIVPDARFDRLVELFKPKKTVPAKIQLFDTPGLIKGESKGNAQRLGIIRESAVLIQVIGVYSGANPSEECTTFTDECILSDLQIVANRIERVKKDLAKPKPAPEREQMQAELDALGPLEASLTAGQPIRAMNLTDDQAKAVRAFALLSGKPILALLNSAETKFDQAVIDKLKSAGVTALAAPVGL
jgi:ribosome-binding ATPase YchF (GTP1/OBG family)